MEGHDTVNVSNLGAFPFVISPRAFPGPHSKSRQGIAPSLSPPRPKQRERKGERENERKSQLLGSGSYLL